MLLPLTLIVYHGRFLLEAKAYFPTTSIAGGLFMLKRKIKLLGLFQGVFLFVFNSL